MPEMPLLTNALFKIIRVMRGGMRVPERVEQNLFVQTRARCANAHKWARALRASPRFAEGHKFQQLLCGLYRGWRLPRVYESFVPAFETATTIIELGQFYRYFVPRDNFLPVIITPPSQTSIYAFQFPKPDLRFGKKQHRLFCKKSDREKSRRIYRAYYLHSTSLFNFQSSFSIPLRLVGDLSMISHDK